MAISKIQLPSTSVEDIHDARIPAPASADNGKVLGVTNASGTLGWVAQSGGVTDVPIITTLPASGMLPNKIYDLGTIQGGFGTKTFTLAEATDTTIANVWQWTFVPSNSPTIAWPTGVTWDGGSAPVTQNGCLYEISVRLIGTYKVAYYKEIALSS